MQLTDMRFNFVAILLFLLALLTGGVSGCAGFTKDFRSAIRFGWSPLAGAYYESTKDVSGHVTMERDPETGEITKIDAKLDSLASTVNPTIVPIQQGYIEQMQVNANLQMHIVDKMTDGVDRLSRMLETVLQVAVSKDGLTFGAANNKMVDKPSQ